MQRTSINPVPWSANLGFDRGQLIEGHRRVLDGRFTTSLLGVTRLFTPELLVLLEATAVD